jgi:O-succinylbenzoic acid--CoA ligase
VSDALSIRDAAVEAGDRPAIVTRDRVITFAEAAATLAAPVEVIDATPAIATVLAVYAALEARQPLALIHAGLLAPERDRQRAAVAAASLPADTAVVLFTSGSTARARGVVLSRAAIIAAAAASAGRLGWRDDDRWLVALSLAHAGGLSIVVRCLAARKPIVLHDAPFDPSEIAELCAARAVTLASLVPTQLAALIATPRQDWVAGLRAVLLGGAAASPALVRDAIARDVPVLPTYGLTESFGQVATATDLGGPPRPLPTIAITAGTAVAPAAISIGGPTLATCYLDGSAIAPSMTTADLGAMIDGALHVVGRADDVIITGGENVHPTQVEQVLAATPGVRAACAFGVADPTWGQIVAAVVAVDPTFDRAAALARWHADLPAHARPRQLALAAALPVLATGKIDRRAAARLPTDPIAYGR